MDAISLLKDRLTLARKWTNDLIVDIDESQWFTPPGPGLGIAPDPDALAAFTTSVRTIHP